MGSNCRTFACVLLLAAVAGCGSGSGDRPLAAVRAEHAPTGQPRPGPEGPLSLDGGCVRGDDTALVFVDGQASVRDLGDPPNEEPQQALELNYRQDGAGHLASIPIDGPSPRLLGFPVDPDEWATEPPAGCDGPYFLVTAVEQPGRS